MTSAPDSAGIEHATDQLRRREVRLVGCENVLAKLIVGGSAAFIVYMIGHGLVFKRKLGLWPGLFAGLGSTRQL